MSRIHILVLIMSAALLPGCGTLSNGRRWGENATMLPAWGRVRRATARAASSPATWLPLAAAGVSQIDHLDERLSDWAFDRTPVFHSHEAARDASTLIHNVSDIGLCASILAAPSGNEPAPWVAAKVKGSAVEAAALLFMAEPITLMKKRSERTRPDGGNDRSFPSRHVAEVCLESTLTYQNIRCTGLPDAGRTAIGAGLAGVSLVDAWARMEEGAHWPSDVLVGLGLGHFFGRFFQEAFLGLDEEDAVIEVVPIENGVAFSVTLTF